MTETDEVARALDRAARRWPGEPRSRLLLRLVRAGSESLEDARASATEERRRAIHASSGKYAGLYGRNFVERMREEWPE